MERSWGKIAVSTLSLTAALLAIAPIASAQGEPDTGAFNAFNLEASNGYRIFVIAGSRKGYRHGEVLVLVARKGRSVSYFAPATVTDTRIDADLGVVGEIDVEFEPSGKKGVTHPVCDRSQRVTYEKGSYVGVVEFHGEEGYMKASAASVPFSLHPSIDLVCGVSLTGESFGPGLPDARLTAWSRRSQGRVALRAIQNRPGARAHFEASIEEKRGKVQVERQVEVTSLAEGFEFASDLRFAALRPDGPFSGTGTFRRGARLSNRWTGNLAVDFPGRSNVSLAGNRFHVSLLHARLSREGTFHPEPSARPNLPPWPSTKPSPTASATFSPLTLR